MSLTPTSARPAEEAAGSPPGPSRKRRSPAADGRPTPLTHLGRWWWAAPAVLLVLCLHYVAVGAGSFYALTDWHGIGPFKFVGLDNFAQVFKTDATRKALVNTIVLAVGFLILTNVLGVLFALALNRTLRSRHFLRVLLFMPVVLSPLAVAYVWKFIFDQTGPLNSLLTAVGLDSWVHTWLADPDTALWTILTVLVWQHLGLSMVIYLAGLAGIPQELEEAAAMDGAGVFRRFSHVTLPLLRPAIIISCTLLLIRGMSVFDQVLALTNGGPFGATDTLSTLVFKETFVNSRYGYGAAISVLLTVLIAVAAVLQIGLLREKER